METLKDWKKFYKDEREEFSDRIKTYAKKHWKQDPKRLNKVIQSQNIISFPHTFIKDNYKTHFDIIKSLYKSGKRKIVLIGVLHTREKLEEKHEFSLDNFEYFLNLYIRENNLEPIKIVKKIFPSPPPKEKTSVNIFQYLKKMKSISGKLKPYYEKGVSILITGDLAHYGYGYGSEDIKREYKSYLNSKINELLEIVYIKKDYSKFIKLAKDIGFDQTSAAIVSSEIIGEFPQIKILSKKFSDYSKLMKSKKPTIVASFTYGLFK